MKRLATKCNHFSNRNSQDKQKRKMDKLYCVECKKQLSSVCNHTDEERSITGFWTTVELTKAIEKGYKIQKIYEVWHFDQSSNDVFKSYIRKFMKIKLQSSKYSGSEQEYREKAKMIEINLDEIKYNAGMRFIAKICLNSLWGKFGQNDKIKHEEYVDNEVRFYKIFCDDKIEDLEIRFVNDKLVEMSYYEKDEMLKENYDTNIYVACYTAANARIRLYEMLDKLQERAIYCDTDSVVYIDDEFAKSVVKIGDSLGEFSIDDKIGEGYIDYWASSAAKDYGGILNNGNFIGKVKGFKIDAVTEDIMTHDNRVKLIKNQLTQLLRLKQDCFVIKKNQIRTVNKEKIWSFNYDKRIVKIIDEGHYDTIPFGY